MTVSTWKLPGLTDQSQKTPATILREKKDLSYNKVGEAQKFMNMIMNIAKGSQAGTCSRVLPAYPLFDSELPPHANAPKMLPIFIQPVYLQVWDVV